MYWPHGLGDWGMLGTFARWLAPTGGVYATRESTDSAAYFEGNEYIHPLYCHPEYPQIGRAIHGELFHIEGVEPSVASELECAVYPDFLETYGHQRAPLHSKVRYNAYHLVGPNNLPSKLLDGVLPRPTHAPIAPELDREIGRRVDELRSSLRTRVALIARTGFSSFGKNWGHRFRDELNGAEEGAEAREFLRILGKQDQRWATVSLEAPGISGVHSLESESLGCVASHRFWDGLEWPFVQLLRALLRHCDLVVAVPTGPLEIADQCFDGPTVSLWIEHYPSWLVEPRPNHAQVVSRNIKDEGYDDRPGSINSWAGVPYQFHVAQSRYLPAESVWDAYSSLM